MHKLTGNEKLYSIRLKAGRRKMTETGEQAESVVSNSEPLAKAIEKANCGTCKEVDIAVSEDVRRHNWRTARKRRCERIG